MGDHNLLGRFLRNSPLVLDQSCHVMFPEYRDALGFRFHGLLCRCRCDQNAGRRDTLDRATAPAALATPLRSRASAGVI